MAKKKPKTAKASESEPDDERPRSEIQLSTPWDPFVGFNLSHSSLFFADEDRKLAEKFIEERSRVHEAYIRETEKTKRVSLVSAVVLILAAAALFLFSPEGREALSYWIGAALVVFSGGVVGYGRVWGKTKNISFGADQDERPL